MSLGGFPGLNALRRRTMRGPDNPMDRCTIFSIYGKTIEEKKPTISPGFFRIPSGTYDNPGLLIVGPSSWWKEVDEEQPLLEIPHSSVQVANSIVNDYVNGLLGYGPDQKPGLFFLHGEISPKELKSNAKYLSHLIKAKERQDNWYKALIHLADSMWARTNGNPLCIADDMRLAAKALNLTGKDWMQDFQMMETVKCIACGMPRNPAYPICPNCKMVVDKAMADKMGIFSTPISNITPSGHIATQLDTKPVSKELF